MNETIMYGFALATGAFLASFAIAATVILLVYTIAVIACVRDAIMLYILLRTDEGLRVARLFANGSRADLEEGSMLKMILVNCGFAGDCWRGEYAPTYKGVDFMKKFISKRNPEEALL